MSAVLLALGRLQRTRKRRMRKLLRQPGWQPLCPCRSENKPRRRPPSKNYTVLMMTITPFIYHTLAQRVKMLLVRALNHYADLANGLYVLSHLYVLLCIFPGKRKREVSQSSAGPTESDRDSKDAQLSSLKISASMFGFPLEKKARSAGPDLSRASLAPAVHLFYPSLSLSLSLLFSYIDTHTCIHILLPHNCCFKIGLSLQ